jgi:fructose-1,6-bisphosphatase-3
MDKFATGELKKGSNDNDDIFDENSINYLKLLSKQYKSIDAASTEIINLQAILNLPKGTEHFLSDVHGEYEAFNHVLKNASGVIKRKIDDIFGNSLRESEKKSLATLVYYPEEKLKLIIKTENNLDDWYKITLYRLIQLCKEIASKYTRSKVRKALPENFKYILEELINEDVDRSEKQDYYNKIIETIISLERANAFIISISKLIQRLSIDRLHIIGDIYDRGPGADIILDTLTEYHSVDIQWGNHDILWMGAASGNEPCICNVLRISSRYSNLHTIEENYGINLLPLATFAMEFYKDDPCEKFIPIIHSDKASIDKETMLIAMMHKAITIIQLKLEGQIIKNSKEFKIEERVTLDMINYEKGTVKIDGKEYILNDKNFPTVDPKNPLELIHEEKELIEKLKYSFANSEKLRRHADFLFSKGSMYLKFNSNLLYHGCIPLNEDGTFKKVMVNGKEYSGKKYVDKLERVVREAYYNNKNLDIMWYLWCGADSPLFGKKTMRTFECCFIDDKETHIEGKNPYYELRDDEEACNKILKEFGLDPTNSHIINGHVPVIAAKGESPIKANGKLIVIDGGFSKAYQKHTGIAGYTLIYNSQGLLLACHESFESTAKAIEKENDILSAITVLERNAARITVGDTDIGLELEKQIDDLKMLLKAYKKGVIKEQM